MTALSTEVAEAVRLRDAATPGPWHTEHNDTFVDSGTTEVFEPDWILALPYEFEEYETAQAMERHKANCRLIAAAPSHVDLIERLFAELEQARVEIEQWKKRSRANWDAARNLADVALKL